MSDRRLTTLCVVCAGGFSQNEWLHRHDWEDDDVHQTCCPGCKLAAGYCDKELVEVEPCE